MNVLQQLSQKVNAIDKAVRKQADDTVAAIERQMSVIRTLAQKVNALEARVAELEGRGK